MRERTREVPWSKFQRTKSLHVPDVKELMRDGAERVFINTWIAERAGLDDLS